MSAPVQNVVPLTDDEAKYLISLVMREQFALLVGQEGDVNPAAIAAGRDVVESIIREFNEAHGEPGLDQLAGKLTVGTGGPG